MENPFDLTSSISTISPLICQFPWQDDKTHGARDGWSQQNFSTLAFSIWIK